MAEVLAGTIPEARDMEVQIERPDGTSITVIVNIRVLRSERGDVIGGILGQLWGGWLQVTFLWVAEAARGQGHGGRLVQAADLGPLGDGYGLAAPAQPACRIE